MFVRFVRGGLNQPNKLRYGLYRAIAYNFNNIALMAHMFKDGLGRRLLGIIDYHRRILFCVLNVSKNHTTFGVRSSFSSASPDAAAALYVFKFDPGQVHTRAVTLQELADAVEHMSKGPLIAQHRAGRNDLIALSA